MNLSEDDLVDTAGKHLESFIAMMIGLGGYLNNFSVANEIKIGDFNYRYQFVLGREGSNFYAQMDEQFEKHGLTEEV